LFDEAYNLRTAIIPWIILMCSCALF